MSDAIVDAKWVADHLHDPGVRLIEVDVSRAAYDQGHIPGAGFWNAYSDLRDASYLPVERTLFEDLVVRSGIERDSTLRRPTREEYDAWSAEAFEGYIEQIAASGSMTRAAAEEKARREDAELLPEGFDTPGQLMPLAEEEGRRHGLHALALNVFGQNTVARNLYTDLDYRETSVQMRKELDPGAEA